MIDCHAYTVSGQWVLRLGGDDCHAYTVSGQWVLRLGGDDRLPCIHGQWSVGIKTRWG